MAGVVNSTNAAPSGVFKRWSRWRPPQSWRESPRVRLSLGVWSWLVLGAILAGGLSAGRVDLRAGQVSPRDIEAPRAFVDRPATDQLRREAAERVLPVYVRDPEAVVQAERRLTAAFARVRAVLVGQDDPPADPLTSLKQALPLDLDDATYAALLQVGDDQWTALERDAREVLRREMSRNITAANLATFRKEAADEVRSLDYPRPLDDFLVKLIESHLRPNFSLDEEQTLRQRQAAMEAIVPVMIVKGEMIVRKGQRISDADLIRLRDSGVLGHRGNWGTTAGGLILSAILVILAGAFLYFFRPKLLANTAHLLLLVTIGLGSALLSQVLLPISGYLAPVAGAAMLLTILLDALVGLLALVLLASIAGFMAGHDLSVAFVALTGGLVGVLGVIRAGQRSDMMRAGFLVALTNVLAITGLRLALSGSGLDLAALGREALSGAANGLLLAGVLTLGSLPYFENFFGVLTSLRLLELSNPNQPLLRRLLLEAPGTYHHSLLVANLAEAGAEAVGANGLLARVGAYYHDVGKMKRPYFFVENQFGGTNPHDKLSPHLSALIVIAHVKEGIELARQYRLPEEIIRFIPEHHGTTRLVYFYERALATGDGETDEAGFRHIGPVPQSRETAIVMLADAAEAVVRSLSRPTPGRVQAAVRRVIKGRLEDGQLNQCDLTLKNLDDIAEAFVRVLSGVTHNRIEYPESAQPAPVAREKAPEAAPPATAGQRQGAAVVQGRAAAEVAGKGGHPVDGGVEHQTGA